MNYVNGAAGFQAALKKKKFAAIVRALPEDRKEVLRHYWATWNVDGELRCDCLTCREALELRRQDAPA